MTTTLTGQSTRLAVGVTRVTAPNPSPMTGPGTNSYVVGTGPFAIIDPGVDDAAHLAALRAAAPGEIAAILITHAHPDHTGGVATLKAATGAPVLAHSAQLAGVRDEALVVDRTLTHGDTLALGEVTLEALHTPGHTADHLCFYARESRWLFAGDTVMADVTVVILPPDGSMTDYLNSLAQLAGMAIDTIAPGHGHLLDDPAATFAHITQHRLDREAQVRDVLDPTTPRSAAAIATVLYPDLDPRLQRMAAAQVQAHLIRLVELGEAAQAEDGWRRLTR
ncbi:MBL fold metallo-hydrolase [Salinisphaera aquimarina]|uniref:MBL fold metallo-hydrolase n=1 Tax=Salinisphaera aquimarina TaxID=2094031 RepID=A0ABV7EQR2_9GAMM